MSTDPNADQGPSRMLRMSLDALAAEPGMQEAIVGRASVDELAEDLHDWLRTVLGRGLITAEQLAPIRDLDVMLDAISGASNARFWTIEALHHERVWAIARELAREALKRLGVRDHQHGADVTYATVRCQIERWVADEPQPGLVEATMTDADGRAWSFIDKDPIFSARTVSRASRFPLPGAMRCEVTGRRAEGGRVVLRISLSDTDADGRSEFEVDDAQVTFRVDLRRVMFSAQSRSERGRASAAFPVTLPLALDPAAASADPERPAFLAPPAGAPAYHGFPLLPDVDVDGFRLGLITNSFAAPASHGDAFLVAPDEWRAGLVWESESLPRFELILPPDGRRWGVYGVWTRSGPTSTDTARQFLADVVAMLRETWQSHAKRRGPW